MRFLNFYILCIVIFCFASIKQLSAQVPSGMSYQAVIRGSDNKLLINEIVSLRMSIIKGSAEGVPVYIESHRQSTNINGLVSIIIGEGEPLSGIFSSIDWAHGPYYLKTETDPNGGDDFSIMGTSQLLSVPYALYSAKSGTPGPKGLSAHDIWIELGNEGTLEEFIESLEGPQGPPGPGLSDGSKLNQMLFWNGTEWAKLDPGLNGQMLTICNDELIWTFNGKCPVSVQTIDCGAAENTGALLTGLKSTSVTSKIPYTGGNGQPFDGVTFSSTGVTGLTASLVPGTLNQGIGFIELIISGIPENVGVASFAISFGGQSCTLLRTVGSGSGMTTDIDGNKYVTAVIGPLECTTTNLKAVRYANGDPIPFLSNNDDWSTAAAGARGFDFGNNLYNWHAVSDPRNVCPNGWRVPTDMDWQLIESNLGMSSQELNTLGWRGDSQNIGGKMRTVGTQFWPSPNSGATNESNFSGRQNTFRFTDGSYYGFNSNFGNWWSSTESDQASGIMRQLSGYFNGVDRGTQFKNVGYPVRCVRDAGTITNLDCSSVANTGVLRSGLATIEASFKIPYSGGNGEPHNGQVISSTGVLGLTATLIPGVFETSGQLQYTITGVPDVEGIAKFVINIGGQSCILERTVINGANLNSDLEYATVADIDGHNYATIKIGNKEWMAQNLRTARYSNGDEISEVGASSTWVGLNTGAWAHYDNSAEFESIYGKLYNGYAVTDTRNICPNGWHVPTELDWQALETALGMPSEQLDQQGPRGGIQNVGGKLRSVGSQYWIAPNQGASNESGFSAIPGGLRSYFDGSFSNIKAYGSFWSSSSSGPDAIYRRDLDSFSGVVIRYGGSVRNGLSVRCVKD